MNLLYRGSVKDIYKDGDHLLFKYSNRYSVFDWGEMPDEIPQKGEALAILAGLFFDYLKDFGVSSHYIKTDSSGHLVVDEVAVLRPHFDSGSYDYSMYSDDPAHCLVPLEVIFRILLGKGNSLEGRLKRSPAYLKDLGLSQVPDSSTEFRPPLVEFSTKLESTDRYLTHSEIKMMRIIKEQELQKIASMTQNIALHLEKLFNSFGVKLWDGKFEFAFGSKGSDGLRSLLLVDSIGPDELRLTFDNAPLSKEFLRQIYAPTSWYKAVAKAKEMATERGVTHWKDICTDELKEVPPPLTPEQIQIASLLYKALANEVAGAMNRPRPFEAEANLKIWKQKCASLL
jgi:phosphoribosylaminoimidazole-succinocarboxamide synthase